MRPNNEVDSVGDALSSNSAAMKANHGAVVLKRLLNERIKLADSPDAVWHDADDVFAELEAHNANQA
jgi:hypothetical protein